MTTTELRQQIIGPLTPKQKAEIRTILEGMGEGVESKHRWDDYIYGAAVVGYSPRYEEWETYNMDKWHPNFTPTISFEEFKSKYMEPKKHPFGMTKESALYIVPILAQAESGKSSISIVKFDKLEEIQELVLHFGGTLTVSKEIDADLIDAGLLTLKFDLKQLSYHAKLRITETQYHLQKAAFSSGMYVAEPGTQLTIIDNQYFQI